MLDGHVCAKICTTAKKRERKGKDTRTEAAALPPVKMCEAAFFAKSERGAVVVSSSSANLRDSEKRQRSLVGV